MASRIDSLRNVPSAPAERLDEERAALYAACFGDLCGYLFTIVGDRALAEDLAQEAGMRLLAEKGALRDARGFLFFVATNLARDQLRRRLIRERTADPLARAVVSPHDPETVVSTLEEVGHVTTEIRRLPERAREVLLLSRLEGLSHREIAERLGLRAKTVEKHLARALALMSERLALRGIVRRKRGSS